MRYALFYIEDDNYELIGVFVKEEDAEKYADEFLGESMILDLQFYKNILPKQ